MLYLLVPEYEQLHYPTHSEVLIPSYVDGINDIGRQWYLSLGRGETSHLAEKLNNYRFVVFGLSSETNGNPPQIIGFAALIKSFVYPNSSEIAEIFVSTNHRRNGIAKELTKRLSEVSKELGFERVTAVVNPSGAYMKLLQKLDFKPCPFGNILIMGKSLNQLQ